MIDHSDQLTTETAWYNLLRSMDRCNEGMQISLYQQFATEHPSYTALCQEKIRMIAAQLIEETEG